jgi:type I restriction enzyme R subunit
MRTDTRRRTFGATRTLLRAMKGEVVLLPRLRAALERLNPALPPESFTAAVEEVTEDTSPTRRTTSWNTF